MQSPKTLNVRTFPVYGVHGPNIETNIAVLIKFESTALKAAALNPNVYLRVISNERVRDYSE